LYSYLSIEPATCAYFPVASLFLDTHHQLRLAALGKESIARPVPTHHRPQMLSARADMGDKNRQPPTFRNRS
jgi:hypothetical protein